MMKNKIRKYTADRTGHCCVWPGGRDGESIVREEKGGLHEVL